MTDTKLVVKEVGTERTLQEVNTEHFPFDLFLSEMPSSGIFRSF